MWNLSPSIGNVTLRLWKHAFCLFFTFFFSECILRTETINVTKCLKALESFSLFSISQDIIKASREKCPLFHCYI